ncbi:membrane metalloprotease [Chloropicon primus]|nr:membrane metalloprotease [Chloropicon primus]UPR00943.1 membrane metalloprotease [Chloropicon primus]|eukprot:QDZ21722.1 membrane metalloprotease [Chloropicon primus]
MTVTMTVTVAVGGFRYAGRGRRSRGAGKSARMVRRGSGGGSGRCDNAERKREGGRGMSSVLLLPDGLRVRGEEVAQTMQGMRRRISPGTALIPAGIGLASGALLLPSSVLSSLEGSASSIQTALALGLVVTVHECGHFAAARLQNIHVSKFSVGFGPCVLRYQGSKVEYSLRLFPFGGFVAFPEEKGDEEGVREYAEDDPNLLNNRPIKDRFLVISAGVVANMVMAFGILWGQALNPGLMQVTYQPGVKVPELASTSLAQSSGLVVDDMITGINGEELGEGDEAVDKVVNTIRASPDKDVTLDLRRSGKPMSVTVRPEAAGDGVGRIGIQLLANADKEVVKASGLLDGAGMASRETAKLTKLVLNGFGKLLFNFQQNVDKLSGPIAIIANGAQYSRNNLYDLLQFMVIVNINLAVINTVPLPGLDGGYLALLLAETVRGGKRLPENVESAINQSGFFLLFVLGITLLVKDSAKLLS